ncbi:hypothetical protein ACFGOO_07265 [Treponema vincentii]|uniref:hypothetical protein n=1 Tax=Treponema vincentii TaxID=69710 RepID=UPI0035F5E25B
MNMYIHVHVQHGATAIHGAVEQLHVRVQPLNDEFFAKQKTSLLHGTTAIHGGTECAFRARIE